MYAPSLRSLVVAVTAIACASAAPSNAPTLVNLRIEGLTRTIYEGPILADGHSITTPSGGTHHCDGTNLNANPTPGPTCTSALDSASKLLRFEYDGTYSDAFDDYFITSIADSTQTATQFWGLLLNYEFTPVGGCQQQVKTSDSILWAFDAFNKQYFLKLSPSTSTAKAGKPYKLTVTDGSTKTNISGATVASVASIPDVSVSATSDADGVATFTFDKAGLFVLKAEHPNAIRSNRAQVLVLP